MQEEIYSATETFEQMRRKTVELFDDNHGFIESSVWVGEMMGHFVDPNDGSIDDDDAVVGVVFGFMTADGERHEFYAARKPMGAIAAMMFIKAMDDHDCDLPMCGVELLTMGMHTYLDLLGIDSHG